MQRKAKSISKLSKTTSLQASSQQKSRHSRTNEDINNILAQDANEAQRGMVTPEVFIYPVNFSEPVANVKSDGIDENEDGPVIVPAFASISVMISYVIIGAILFGEWEKWDFITSAYFCFISLVTIGFGDMVPGDPVKDYTEGSSTKLLVSVAYLLVGMALLAMCFNLMQEELVYDVKRFARNVGLLVDRRKRRESLAYNS